MQYSMRWIGQEYRFAGDIKWQRGQQARGKLLRRLNCIANECPQFQFDGKTQNKAQTSSPKGGREKNFTRIIY